MASSAPDVSLFVTFRGVTHTVTLPSDSSLSTLHDHLEALTLVPPSLQKLLYKGKKVQRQEDTTLLLAGLRNGIKVQMLGSTQQEVEVLNTAETEHQKRERILRERALKPQAKLRSTGSSSTTSSQYRFHQITPLRHLPNPDSALSHLTTLSNDPAIRHVMHNHRFSVGVLTELAPHENPELLGLNVNAGQSIKLRLRTDAYDGFRPYLEVRRVLCHELAHNVHGDHDENFKELNSKLNREVAEFEAAVTSGTNYLSENVRDAYRPSSNEEAEALMHVLGGSGNTSRDNLEDRRRKALEAATARLRKEEEELEKSCGTTR
ncbi:WLM-domain-containing protein [Hygrophoropsis aurantiaca]|uniref:WLM-domain-containing protein n=1 Tax=Hygrophoropsis aurantiaca TaxID=72124 RepID=A0ACB8ANM1_9AGAM|nr:WLM-domain-containing protein [Hygrophoropsis aurantiaca]